MPAFAIDLGAERFNVRVDGSADAPALVLSNSLGTTLSMWESQMAELTSHFRVIRYDTRGHGASTTTRADYKIETLGGDVLRILDFLGIARARFCGLSMGGATGMWLAIHAPDRIGRLVLANTATKFGTTERWNARIEAVTNGGMAAIADGVIETWFTSEFRTRAPDDVARLRRMLIASPVPGYLAACRAVRDVDLTADIDRIDCPTLVIVGRHDLPTPPAQGRAIGKAIAGAQLIELPTAHISNVEAASAFSAALVEFLAADEA